MPHPFKLYHCYAYVDGLWFFSSALTGGSSGLPHYTNSEAQHDIRYDDPSATVTVLCRSGSGSEVLNSVILITKAVSLYSDRDRSHSLILLDIVN